MQWNWKDEVYFPQYMNPQNTATNIFPLSSKCSLKKDFLFWEELLFSSHFSGLYGNEKTRLIMEILLSSMPGGRGLLQMKDGQTDSHHLFS